MHGRTIDQPDFLEGLVIMSARHGEKYFGWIPTAKGDPQQYIEAQVNNQKPILMEEVRVLVSNLQVANDGAMMLLMPIDTFASGVEKLWVYPSSWYFPKDNERCQAKIRQMYKMCLEMELAKAASDLNLVIPGLKRNLPPMGGKIQ